jgi:hypothetical protein
MNKLLFFVFTFCVSVNVFSQSRIVLESDNGDFIGGGVTQ